MKSHSQLLHDFDGTIIIMDACRALTFLNVYYKLGRQKWLGKYDHEFSLVSNGGCVNTEHWYWTHLDRAQPDTMLIGGHPIGWGLYSKIEGRLMKDWFGSALPTWKHNTFPEPKHTLEVAASYCGDKRLLVHLIPPHLPFMAPMGKALHDKLNANQVEYGFKGGGPTSYELMQAYGRTGNWEELLACYRESVAYGLMMIEQFVDRLPSPIVITSDHGEMIGENNRYNHDMLCPVIENVPWLVLRER